MNSDLFLILAAPLTLTVLLVAIHTYLGLHVIEREVIFVDISLSQIAALGAGLSELFLNQSSSRWSLVFSLALCMIVSLALSIFRQSERKISQEAIIGITYALASSCLVLVMDRLPHGAEHLKEALVGNILFVTWPEVIETALIYILIGILHFVFRKQFWANSRGETKSFLWDFFFYFLFGVVITFSTHHAGVLVVFSVLVVPAALAHSWGRSVTQKLILAWVYGVTCCAIAFLLSYKLDMPAGATIVSVLTSLFFTILITRIFYDKYKSKRHHI